MTQNKSIGITLCAIIYVPPENEQAVLEKKRKASESEGMKFTGMKDGYAVYEIVSGNYHFNSKGITGMNFK